MRNGRDNQPTDAEIDRSQSRIAAVLGPEEIAKLEAEALPGIGHNRPAPIDIATERVDREVESANAWAEQVKVIESEDVAAQVRDKLEQLRKLWQEYDTQRTAERNPHVEAAAAVQRKWVPLLNKLDICRKAIKPLEDAWLRLLRQRQTEERQTREREAAEAQRRADQLAEQANAGGRGAVTNMIAATEAAGEAERARQAVAAVPQRAQTRGTLGGPARSLRVTWQANVVDWDKCYQHYRERGEVRDVLSRLANADARNGVRNPGVPGCWIFSEEG